MAMQQQGETGLISLWQTLQTEVEAQVYSNIFLIVSILTIGGAILGFFLRSVKSASGSSEPVEIG
ncbi:MAG TPA: hypothetical protein VGD73_12620 [Pseudonocardia sp.]|uniref:hypothetical protein n=1 Tax=Pseudonocardia sp. TaxID=60912 RepID=UPI002ED913D9